MLENMKDLLVKLDLQHFADESQQSQDSGSQGVDEVDTNNKPDAVDDKQQEHMIPKSRFDEVNTKLKSLQKQLESFTAEKEAQELESKKKNGEFEQLYTSAQQELDKFKETSKQASTRVEQLENVIQGLVDKELEAIPDDLKDLIPEGFTPEQKLTWIATAKSKGLFGDTHKQFEELGGKTNPPEQKQDVSKMSITELFKSAYGSKK